MKNNYLVLLLCCFAISFSQAQIVNIPDPVFKEFLLVAADTNNDGEIQDSEASNHLLTVFEITDFDTNNQPIADITGLEAFTNIESFSIYNFSGTTLDITPFQQLTVFGVINAPLTNFIAQNPNLFGIGVTGSQIQIVDLSQCAGLEYIDLQDNQLTDITLSPNLNLKEFGCYNNQLTTLDFRTGNNNNIEYFNSTGNLNLQCIYVDDSNASYLSSWNKDTSSLYVNNEAECTTLSIDENEIINSIILYPNPIKNQLKVNVSNGTQINTIEMFSLTGKRLLSFEASENYNISKLTSGVYFVKIKTNKGDVIKQIIKE